MLDRLPAEILDNILEEVSHLEPKICQGTAFYSLALACRSLHNPACLRLYREVRFGHNCVHPQNLQKQQGFLGFRQLLLFLRTVEEGSVECEASSQTSQHRSFPWSCGNLVHHVTFDIGLEHRDGQEQFKTPDCGRVERILERLLKRVPNVQTLVISAWTESGSVIVNLDDCHRFTHLQDLRIITDGLIFPQWLFQRPGLRTVAMTGVDVRWGVSRMCLPSSVTGLWVCDPEPSSQTTVDGLLTYPPGLETFGYLGSMSPYANRSDRDRMNAIKSFLQPVHSTLKRLELHSYEPPNGETRRPTPAFLNVFSALESLTLSGSWLTGRVFEKKFTLPSTLQELHFHYPQLRYPGAPMPDSGSIVPEGVVEKLVSLKKTGVLVPSLRLISFTESGPLLHPCHVLADSPLAANIEDDLRGVELRLDCYFIVPRCLAGPSKESGDMCTPCRDVSSRWKRRIPKGRIHPPPIGFGVLGE